MCIYDPCVHNISFKKRKRKPKIVHLSLNSTKINCYIPAAYCLCIGCNVLKNYAEDKKLMKSPPPPPHGKKTTTKPNPKQNPKQKTNNSFCE